MTICSHPPAISAAKRSAIFSVLALCLTACEVGPDYQAPQTNLTAFHNAPPVDAGQSGTAPLLDTWWTGFNDPELTRVEQRALDQNLDLAAALGRVEQSRAQAASAGAQLLPTVDFDNQAEYLRQSTESPFGKLASHFPGYSRVQRTYDVGAAASWEIDLFGGLRRGVEAATAEAAAAEADRAGTRVTVAADAADAYFQVRGDQARLAVAEQQIAVDAHLLDLIRSQRAQGVASEREVAQSEALLKQARATVPLIRTDLEAELNRLDVLMGAQPGTYATELAATADIASIPAVPAADQPLDMLRRRPDIVAAERRVAAASAHIGVAIADYYPKLSLSGMLGFESLDGDHLFTAAAFQPQATGAIRWRVFDFGKVDAEVAEASGADAEALAVYRGSVLRAAEDVEDAFSALTQTEARMLELRDEVAALTRARDLSQQSYESGTIALTDVLDADRQLLAAKDDLAQNRADAARAAVRSFRSLGGGWSPTPARSAGQPSGI